MLAGDCSKRWFSTPVSASQSPSVWNMQPSRQKDFYIETARRLSDVEVASSRHGTSSTLTVGTCHDPHQVLVYE